ncbi:MAG: 4-(cytidine 5'-diphospho)-2-C-methyl-D-erythritol kinase [Rhodobacteraceae bacterium]|nr:4-(cytidine 5'-diphospho)-2-C-methyl-D-erythritol kinase [Paracoccaceae bacterium]
MTEVRAPAKINLTLHVTGQRDDGYHLLDSLVAFSSLGDTVKVRLGKVHPGNDLTLTLSGPESEHLCVADNLVLRAARLFRCNRGARIELVKCLPVASGIGGGSADAAATLKALSRFWELPLPDKDAILGLGADVPVCLLGVSARMSGIGDELTPVPPLPADLGIVLINPRVAVSTPAVFNQLKNKANEPMQPTIPAFEDAQSFGAWLNDQRNDLQDPAMVLNPVIGDVLDVLSAQNPLLARMSGSGATCFGLYATEYEAKAVGRLLREQHPGWWVRWGGLIPLTDIREYLSPTEIS